MTRLYAGPVDLFDGTGTKVERRRGILIEDGRFAWVGAHARAPKEARDAVPLGVEGTVVPGLFDCHVHLCFDGDADFLAEAGVSEATAAIKAARNAERHLASGITTVRDLGSMGSVAVDVGRAVEEARVLGARVIPSGRALTITGGHGWNSFAEQVDGAEGVRVGVRRQIRSGARSIKVVATGGVLTPGVTLDFVSFTEEELASAVEEAHRWGFPIAAHAHGEEGIARATRAGVDSIEHGSVAGAATMKLLAERGTFHVPTFGAHAGIVDHPDQVAPYVIEKGRQIFEAAKTSFRHAVKAGRPPRHRYRRGHPVQPPRRDPHGDRADGRVRPAGGEGPSGVDGQRRRPVPRERPAGNDRAGKARGPGGLRGEPAGRRAGGAQPGRGGQGRRDRRRAG